MNHSRIRWAAVALFAAVMTVAEVVALQAIARDASRWMSSESAREIRQAGRAVSGMVTGKRRPRHGEFAVIRMERGVASDLRTIVAEARACGHGGCRVRATKWSWSSSKS